MGEVASTSGSRMPRMRFRSMRAVIALLLLAVLGPNAAWALDASPSDIVANPHRYDGQSLTTTGRVTRLRSTVSRRGNPYYWFELRDARSGVTVFSFGTPECSEGTRATVEGRFDKVKQVSGRTFYNEISAS